MLALIDGDVIAYLACKSRYRTPEGALVVLLDRSTKHFEKYEDREYLESSWEEFKNIISDSLEKVWATEHLTAVKGDSNFRDTLYPQYKANRKKDPSKTNSFVPILRKLAVVEGLAIPAEGREADDLLRIWATQADAAEEDYIIISNDKDLDCIPGKHYNVKKNILFEVTPEEATRFFYQQLISGDTVDNIPGVPGMGPVKAQKLMHKLLSEETMQEIVVEQYFGAYGPEGWYDALLSNGKLLYLQKTTEDYFCCSHWPIVKELRWKEPEVAKAPVLSAPSKIFTGGIPKKC